MSNCALCLKNEADKKGSHIIPSFLLKMVENVDNSGKRDKGLGFRLTEEDVTIHFERAVPGEKIEKLMGELDDEQLRSYPSPSIRDHIFCSNCETYLGTIESAYSASLTTFDEGSYVSSADPLAAVLLWTSIFWRASVAQSYGMIMSKDDEETCRKILVHFAAGNKEIAEIEKELSKINYKLIRAPKYSDEKNGFLAFEPNEEHPYCLILGEIACFLYLGNEDLERLPESFFEFETILSEAKLNNYSKKEEILNSGPEIFAKAGLLLAEKFASIKIPYLEGLVLGTALMVYGIIEVPADKVKSILQKISSDEGLMGKKYSKEEVISIIAEELKPLVGK